MEGLDLADTNEVKASAYDSELEHDKKKKEVKNLD